MPVTLPPTAPSPSDSNMVFDQRIYDLVNWYGVAIPQMNALETNVNAKEVSAVASAAAAVAAANFKGDWAALSGALNVPASVSYGGSVWLLLTNLPNVAAATPGVSASWLNISGTTPSSINGGAVSGLKEKIINGRMEVSQYYGTTAVTPTVSGTYTIDRFQTFMSVASKLSYQQVADAPAGFKYSTKITVVAQYSPAAGDYFQFQQPIEGLNLIDVGFGTITPLQVTASFYVKGSVAGTYAISLWNALGNRSYVGTVTVTTSWAKQSVLLTTDNTGTWATDNTAGLYLCFDLGCGTTFNTTANAWQAGNCRRTSACTTFVNQTAGSTLNITGVSLKAGDCRNETYNEWRPYPIERGLCLWYAKPLAAESLGYAINSTSLYANGLISLGNGMRVAPSLAAGATFGASTGSVGAPSISVSTQNTVTVYNGLSNWTTNAAISISGLLTSEL